MTRNKPLPSAEELNFLFEYKDGVLFWKQRKPGRKRGFPAGTMHKIGYVAVHVNGNQFLAHRIIFKMLTGKDPEAVDHINGKKSDNRIENLRSCTYRENSFNKPLTKQNKSGVKNVSWYAPYKKWRVALRIQNKQKNFGYFDDIELAELVAAEARDKHHSGFANHG